MPTATLKSPRSLAKYGRNWKRGEEVPIDFKEYKRMEGDPRFTFGGVKITTEPDPDEVVAETTTPAKRPSKGRSRTKVSDVVPEKTKAPAKPAAKAAAKKTGAVKLVKKGAAAATAPDPEVDKDAKGDDTKPEDGDTSASDEGAENKDA